MRIVGYATGHVGVTLQGRSLNKYYVTRIPLFDEYNSGFGCRRNLKQRTTTVESSGGTQWDQVH
jgi:hypothetical protein